MYWLKYTVQSTPMCFPLPDSIIWSPSGCLASPVASEGIHDLMPVQACFSLQNSFVRCLGFLLYVGLSHVFPPPITQGLMFTPAADPLKWYNCSFKAVTSQSPLCRNKVSFLSSSCGQAHPALFPAFHRHVTLAHLHRAFFQCWGLLVSHGRIQAKSKLCVSDARKEHINKKPLQVIGMPWNNFSLWLFSWRWKNMMT